MELIQGDCVEELQKLPANSVDCVITSPPYYNAKEYSQYEDYDCYLSFLENVFIECFRVLKIGRMCCVNISPIIIPREKRSKTSKRIPIPFHLVNIMEKIGFKFLEDIHWIKPNGSVPNRNGGFFRHHKPVAYKPNCVNEYILVFQKGDYLIDNILKEYSDEVINDSLVNDDYDKTNLWYFNPESKIKHPAPFPLDLPFKLIRYYSFVGDTVLDCFMGSGTTGVACNKLNRNFIGIELNEDYFELAKGRLN